MKILKRSVVAFMLAAPLVACSDPEGEANKTFVQLAGSLTEAVNIVDPIEKHDRMAALRAQVADLQTKYPQTAVAVRIASNEKIGPLSLADIDFTLKTLALDPAFCARDLTMACLSSWYATHSATLADDERLGLSLERTVIAIRQGDANQAGDIMRTIMNALKSPTVTDRTKELLQTSNAVFEIWVNDVLKTPGKAWSPFPESKPLWPVMNANSAESFWAQGISSVREEKRQSGCCEKVEDIDYLVKAVQAAPSSAKGANDLGQMLRMLVSEDMSDAAADYVLKTMPSEKLNAVMASSSALPLYRRLPKGFSDAAAASFTPSDYYSIPWDAMSVIDDSIIDSWKVSDKPEIRTVGIRMSLAKHGDEMSADDYLAALSKFPEEDTRRANLRSAIVKRMGTQTDDAVRFAVALISMPYGKSHPEDVAHDRRTDQIWFSLAASRTPEDARRAIAPGVNDPAMTSDELYLRQIASQHPDLLGVRDVFQYHVDWLTKNRTGTYSSYVSREEDAVLSDVAGSYPIKNVKDEDFRYVVDTAIGKGIVKVKYLYGSLLDELVKKGASPDTMRIVEMTAMRQDGLNMKEEYLLWKGRNALNGGDMDTAINTAADPTVSADRLFKNNIAPGLGREPSNGFIRKLLSPDVKLDNRKKAILEASYVRWLTDRGDKAGLAGIVFHPEQCSSQAWMLAVSSLMGTISISA